MTETLVMVGACAEVMALVALAAWAVCADVASEHEAAARVPIQYLLLPVAQILVLGAAAVLHMRSPHAGEVSVAMLAVGAVCICVDAALLGMLARALRMAGESVYEAYVEAQMARMEADLIRLQGQADNVVQFRSDVVRGLKDVRESVIGHVATADEVTERLSGVAGMLDATLPVACAHPALNALLQAKNHRCEELGISFLMAVDVPADIGLPSTDLCGVFFNLIDNAINGCKDLAAGRRFVQVKAHVDRGFLVVEVINSCKPGGQDAPGGGEDSMPTGDFDAEAQDAPIVIFVDDVQPKAPQLDPDAPIEGIEAPESLLREHGWGLQIVEQVVTRHNGLLNVHDREGIYEVAATISVSSPRT